MLCVYQCELACQCVSVADEPRYGRDWKVGV